MNILKTFCAIAFGAIASMHCHAQREFANCDSTIYSLSADTFIVAGRHSLYFGTAQGIQKFADFQTDDATYFIRDFDILNDSTWFTLWGSRYLGDTTVLFKTTNRGASWQIDSSFYTPVNGAISGRYNSVNQLQVIGKDSIVLFVGYYSSGLVYSVNAGASWKTWFNNLIVNYQGFFVCDTIYYLYSFEGDAFKPWMFAFGKSKLFADDTLNSWDSFSQNSNHPTCSGQLNPLCVYAPSSLNRCGQYQFLKAKFDSICATKILSIGSVDFKNDFFVFPNPVVDVLNVDVAINELNDIQIINALSVPQQFYYKKENDKLQIDCSALNKGFYFLLIRGHGWQRHQHFVKN